MASRIRRAGGAQDGVAESTGDQAPGEDADLAESTSAGSVKDRLVTNNATVNPMPAQTPRPSLTEI